MDCMMGTGKVAEHRLVTELDIDSHTNYTADHQVPFVVLYAGLRLWSPCAWFHCQMPLIVVDLGALIF